MPELPEVETTLRGIEPWIIGEKIARVEVPQRSLRWPVPEEIGDDLVGQVFVGARRRSKYLLFELDLGGTLLVHLGMSGSLRILHRDGDKADGKSNDPASEEQPDPLAWRKHDHVGLTLGSGKELRFHDPRRFGCWLFSPPGDPPEQSHALLKNLGPEPLEDAFNQAHLWARTRKRSVAIKQLIMNAKDVVGVGNIYACESLFLAGISPTRAAGKLTKKQTARLVETIKQVLREAIAKGGTTLRDFVNAEGEAGYFQQELLVYDREGDACRHCDTEIKRIVQSNRSTFFCSGCQR